MIEHPSFLFIASTSLLSVALFTLIITDFRRYRLPNIITLPLIPLGLVFIHFLNPQALANHTVALIVGGGVMLLIARGYTTLRNKDGLGMGDVKLMAAAGAWVGLAGLPSVLLIGSITSLILVALKVLFKGPLKAQDKIPFGAFLSLALWITWVFGPLQFLPL